MNDFPESLGGMETDPTNPHKSGMKSKKNPLPEGEPKDEPENQSEG